eukprot:scaffold86684_cov23-Prasinocladus_malaysianus.AAC.1
MVARAAAVSNAECQRSLLRASTIPGPESGRGVGGAGHHRLAVDRRRAAWGLLANCGKAVDRELVHGGLLETWSGAQASL